MQDDDTPSRATGELRLTPEEAEHTRRVAAHIRQCMRSADGWLPFEQFMELALYAPGLGYYTAGTHKLGHGGDFVTAPEVSRLFGGCVARQCAQVLDALNGGEILEIGAGTGRLAVDVLRRLDSLGRLPDRYRILEVSADLRDRQRALLSREVPSLLDRVGWLDAPPASFEGMVLANEVLDALPVARFRWCGDEVMELGVASGSPGFVWSERPASARVRARCRQLFETSGGAWPVGYASEYCPRLPAWSAEVTRGLRRGLALWIDYGLPRPQYYLAERIDGTLVGHFRQRMYEDVLMVPGLQDITAWVDFTALAEAGVDAGFEIAGFTTQAHFLAGCGVDVEMQTLAGGDSQRFARLAGEARRLMLPGEMGERFKAMGWVREVERDWRGFGVRDFTSSL